MSTPTVAAAVLLSLLAAASLAGAADFTFKSSRASLVIGSDCLVRSLTDDVAGIDVSAGDRPAFVAFVNKTGGVFAATSCSVDVSDSSLLTFSRPSFGSRATVRVVAERAHFRVTLLEASTTNPDFAEVSFARIAHNCSQKCDTVAPLCVSDSCGIALLAATVNAKPSITQKLVTASAYVEWGMTNASVFVIVGPSGSMRQILKEELKGDSSVPHSEDVGGPWAIEDKRTRLSYIFADPNERNVDSWIEMCKTAGIGILHFAQGWDAALGHYNLNPKRWSNRQNLTRALEKIHSAGLLAGMHTLCGGIALRDAYKTDDRLATDGVYTLKDPLDASSTAQLQTIEKPGKHDVVLTSSSRGNILRVDKELISYNGTTDTGFTGLTRGAYDTVATAHAANAVVQHLLVRYRTYQPDPQTTLMDEIAQNIARTYNLGFDFIYHDGAEGMNTWYGEAAMRRAMQQALNRSAIVESSTWDRHSWPFHSRLGAWDYPVWGIKRFVDFHVLKNLESSSSYLPTQLGWWGVKPSQLPDEFEYLCSKAVANDMGLSFQGFSPSAGTARQAEFFDILRKHEELRKSGLLTPVLLATMATPKAEFHLEQHDAAWDLIPVDYLTSKLEIRGGDSSSVTIQNSRGAQPLRTRVALLGSLAPYETGMSLVQFQNTTGLVTKAAPSVAVKVGAGAGLLSINASSRLVTRLGSWASVAKTFTPDISLGTNNGGLGVWVYGDGQGEILNFQMASPAPYEGTYDEHYVDVDFVGWRYFELLISERDSSRYGDYKWPYSNHYYLYRQGLTLAHIRSLTIWVNNIPANGSIAVQVRPVVALAPVNVTAANVTMAIPGGDAVVFPVTMKTGDYLEFLDGPKNVKLFSYQGVLLANLTSVVQGTGIPVLASGTNTFSFSATRTNGILPTTALRASVTVMTSGTAIQISTPSSKDSLVSDASSVVSEVNTGADPVPGLACLGLLVASSLLCW